MDHSRDSAKPVIRPVGRQKCVVAVCSRERDAAMLGEILSELNTGSLVTYRESADLMFSVPAGQVTLAILAGHDAQPKTRCVLDWVHRRWPHCPIVVVDEGSEGCERMVRQRGALYLTDPVARSTWQDLLSHFLLPRRRVRSSI